MNLGAGTTSEPPLRLLAKGGVGAITGLLLVGLALAAIPQACGYTISLMMWLAPGLSLLLSALYLGWREDRRHEAIATAITFLCIISACTALEFISARHFFEFPNENAVVGLYLPGIDFSASIQIERQAYPIEELLFYAAGTIWILGLYLYGRAVWAPVDGDRIVKHGLGKLALMHALAVLIGVLLLAAEACAKPVYASVGATAFPSYFSAQVVVIVIPTITLLGAVHHRINRPALSLTMGATVLMSALYEGAIGLPEQWWKYRDETLIGINFGETSVLPIEAATFWVGAVTLTVCLFESVCHCRNR